MIATNELTVAAFNAHWGIGRFGAVHNVRYDVAAVVESFDADVIVVPEAWRSDDGDGVLDPLADRGYRIEIVEMMPLALRRDRNRDAVPADGIWELAVCSRFPVVERRSIPIGVVKTDPAGPRNALSCTLDVHGRRVEVVGLHTSSKVWKLAPVWHIRRLRSQLSPNGTGPMVIAGDFNFWGPPASALLPGFRRTVRGRTYPSHRPHSGIDHVMVHGDVEVVSAEVLPRTPSDHRPVRARLRMGSRVT